MTATREAMKPITGNVVKPRVFGIQPSGQLHLGNYLGAIRRWVENQEKWDNIYCIVDLHAVTRPRTRRSCVRRGSNSRPSSSPRASIRRSARSSCRAMSVHAQLAWLINCVTPLGWLERMTQYKDKAGENRERESLGLLAYPCLMAADILLYHANGVPVGEDQKQHVELTRDVAERFNRLYGEVFTIPEPWIGEAAARVMGLDEPTKKMSKSATGRYHAIFLTDTADQIREKIKRATTDSVGTIVFDEERPGIFNLLSIYQAFTGESRQEEIEERFAGKGYGAYKQALADLVVDELRPLAGELRPPRRRPRLRRGRAEGGRGSRPPRRPEDLQRGPRRDGSCINLVAAGFSLPYPTAAG